MCATEGIQLDPSISEDFLALMKKFSAATLSSCSDESFKALFWQQQLKAASVKKATGMRWHPLMIKWCIYLQYK